MYDGYQFPIVSYNNGSDCELYEKDFAMPSLLTAPQVLDTYFLETRAKLLEIAANLDRFDRATMGADVQANHNDPRLTFIQNALKILQTPSPSHNRAEQIQTLYSLP